MRALAQLFGLLSLIVASITSSLAGNVNLAWDPVNDSRVAGYKIHYGTSSRNYAGQIDVGNVTARTVSNLTDGATYYFAVTAYDGTRVESGFSNEVVGTVPSGAPVANFTASTTSGYAPLSMNFTSTSTGSITAYAWTFGDGSTSSSQNPAKTYSTAGTYTVGLTVTGPGGSNTKTVPNYITVTTAADTTPPTAPASLTATASGSSSINLSWNASTDNVGVTGYRLERCMGSSCTNFVQIATRTGTTFGDTGLVAGASYRYRVRAIDAANNLSTYSPIAAVTTAAAVDTTPPTAPASLTATASGSSSINLSWNASTDNVGVTGYHLERCQGTSCTNFVQIATRTGTTFGDSGLAAGTSYRYRVRSTDAAGKLSAYSAIATATTVAPLSGTNFALASNGGAASASSTASASYSVTGINNGERAGAGWGTGSGGWNDATASTWPDWVQITFNGSKSIDRIVVYTLQDSYGSPVEPTDTMTFTQYGVRDFHVQGWTGSSWVTLATVTGNNLVKRTVTFPAFTTDRVRVAVSAALWGHSRITEIEAWGR